MNRTRLALAAVLSLMALSVSARADGNPPVVHVDAASDVILERIDDDGHATRVCQAPCDTTLDTRPRYQLTGEGLRASNRFNLPESSAATVAIKPRSSGGFVSGIVLMTISGVFATGGFSLLGAMVAAESSGGLGGAVGGGFAGLGAIVCATASLATGIPGILLLTNNIQSRAKVMEGDRLATKPTAPPATLVPLLTQSF